MTIRISRSVETWQGFGEKANLRSLLKDRDNLPLATKDGGFIFVGRDGLELVYELHTIFSPPAWGTRVLALAAREAFAFMFDRGMKVCFTYEVDGNWRSQPPRSHGWKVAGDFADTRVGVVCPWILTEAAWKASPVGRKRG